MVWRVVGLRSRSSAQNIFQSVCYGLESPGRSKENELFWLMEQDLPSQVKAAIAQATSKEWLMQES